MSVPRHKPPPKMLSRSLFPEEMSVLPLIQGLVPRAFGGGDAMLDGDRGSMLIPCPVVVVVTGLSSRRKEEGDDAMTVWCGNEAWGG